MNSKENAGTDSVKNHTRAAKGFQSFAANDSHTIKEIAKQLKGDRLRRDNAALRLPPMHCGCHDPMRCRCFKGRAA